MNKIRIVQNKPTVKEAVVSSLSMEQVEAIYKILSKEFGEEHIKDMFTLGDLSLYNMLVKGGVAGIQENINEDKADAARWFGNLKSSYQKGLTSPDLKDPADKTEYKRLVKDFFSKLEVDAKVRPIGEAAYDSATQNELAQYIINLSNELKAAKSRGMDKKVKELQKDIEEVKAALAKKKKVTEASSEDKPIGEEIDVLNKIADMFDRKYPHLKFDVREPMDRIDVRGDQQDLFNFGTKLAGEKIFGYEVSHDEDDDRGEVVRIIKSDRIKEGDGLWANIRAKQERGEKPARKGSKAYKIAKKAGDEINKQK